ncbi:MAG: hypothetical protein ACR2HQ_07610 [Ilumatobacteraceae bacterium]
MAAARGAADRRATQQVSDPSETRHLEVTTMGYGLDRFAKAAAPVLAPGERILGGTWARTPGGTSAERVLGPIAGIATQFGSASAGDLRLPKAFEVAVTDRRLLFFSRSAVTARPSDLVGELALRVVLACELTGEVRGIHGATIHLADGRSIQLEVAKLGAGKLTRNFVAAVERQLASDATTSQRAD